VEFTVTEIKEVANNLSDMQLKAHLDDLTNQRILVKNNEKYKLNK